MTTYAWTLDGHVLTGTLDNYAKDIKQAYHHGLQVGRLHRLEALDKGELILARPVPLVTRRAEVTHDYYQTTYLRDEETDETASYRIDLRA